MVYVEITVAFQEKIRAFVTDLANGNLSALQYGGVSASDLAKAVREYGRTLVPLPDNAFAMAEVYDIGSNGRTDVYLPLWTKEEGRSDLTLFVSCFSGNGEPVIEVNDLRVL
jgi:hypothetical protein